MSVLDLHAGRSRLSARLAALRSRLGSWGEAYVDHLSRSDEIRRLEALSDAELAAMGLARSGIVAHVFRDRIGL